MNMEQFYKNVINDLGKRLYDNLANKEQQLDAERIDAMKNEIRKKMENPEQLFNSAISVRHSSLNRESLLIPIKKDIVQESKVKKEQIESQSSDQDLQLFKNNQQQNPIFEEDFVKKEEVSPEEGQQKLEGERMQENRFDEEQREMKQQAQKLKQNLSVHILGMYEKKKHIARDQLIKLDLENVFIKIKDQKAQVFYPRMSFQLKNT